VAEVGVHPAGMFDGRVSSNDTAAQLTRAPLAPAGELTYSYSAGLMGRLARANVSLAFTSYESGYLYMLGSSPGHGAQLHQSAVAKPMGLSADASGSLTLACGASIIRYRDVLKPPHERINHIFDACYMPRTMHVTGDLDAHDVGLDGDGRVVFVNTRFNCLATISETHSFEELWRPPFISALVDEDRCHLNGLTMDEGRPAYVTAVSRSDTIDGWRDRRADGGVVLDVRSGEVVCEGLSMPHSPRLHRGELWVANAGTGELGVVRRGPGGGAFEPKVFCPGFVRGLAFHDGLAFVGLSKPRYHRFEGLPLADRLRQVDSEPWCGVQVIDLDKGSCVDWFRIDGHVVELYDLALIEGRTCPMAVSPGSPDASSLITFDTDRTARSAPPAAIAPETL
jgi:uncharacterized protein (TIGR03032 family)